MDGKVEENSMEKKLGFCVHRLDVTVKRALDARMKKLGVDEVTLMHGWIIRYLYDNREKDVYQKDIEKHCCVGRSTVTGIIQLMEKKGLICREAVENDARLKKVLLTPQGKHIYEAIEAAINSIDREMAEVVSPEELEIFVRAAQRMQEKMEHCREG
ncbi:MAG: MarR family transcriptional regulator [Candidatus Gastranaerophilales bacterium]|nr:MarR family transcriptional regulator [Candidatus Gastranaerophilales bacterium]